MTVPVKNLNELSTLKLHFQNKELMQFFSYSFTIAMNDIIAIYYIS